MRATEPVLAFDTRLELGESPVWDERSGTLYVVDILRGSITRCDPYGGKTEIVAWLDEFVGSIALRRDGGLVAATGTAVVLLDEHRAPRSSQRLRTQSGSVSTTARAIRRPLLGRHHGTR